MFEFSIEILLLLMLVAFLSGYIDAIAGGGGLLTIPTLMFAGLTPIQAIATNKLQACFGSFSASRFYIRAGLVAPKAMRWSIVVAAVSAAVGAFAIQWIAADVLLLVMPFVFIAVALFLMAVPNVGKTARPATVSERTLNQTAVPAVSFYDGFLGPGTGTFFTLSYAQLRGLDLVKATAHAKVLNFTTNIVSLLIFLVAGHMVLVVGLSMAVAQVIGARLGAAAAIRRGVGFIRGLTVIVCIAMSLSLLLRAL